MRFIALFFDDVQPAQIDADLTREHFDYLAACGDRITDAGGLRDGPEAPFCGSLWIIEAESLDEAQALADGDPYCKAGLRPDYRVLQWNRAPLPKTD
ncbi:YciI family protein [Tropicimonas sp. IMCC34011]|uniref:YciI family protein n=1 Tax=Tropicimonas sp. IMCC34011 TaxID=2248759 RepID=UPI000E234812|nr:YciI family protein [Tropicimonas sp. IMCC34011]